MKCLIVLLIGTSVAGAADPTRIGGITSSGRADAERRAAEQRLAERERQAQAEKARLAMEARWAKTRAENDGKILAWQWQRARRGEASGQYEIGLRYLTGDGLTNDLAAARLWLGKAAGQGHAPARKALSEIAAQQP